MWLYYIASIILANCGATALHYAAESGHLEIVSMLLRSGAKLTRNSHGLTPLLSAAEECQEEIVNLILDERKVDNEQQISALELLGASFANDKENYNLFKCYAYLRKAMTLRWADQENPISKEILKPIEGYGNHTESQTLEELLSIRHDDHALHMEGLTIRERILGIENPLLVNPIIFRGAVEADFENFERSVNLWLHVLRIKQGLPDLSTTIAEDIERFSWAYCQIIYLGGLSIDTDIFLEVMRATCREVKRIRDRSDEMEPILKLVIYLAVVFCKIEKTIPEEHKVEIQKQFFEIIRTRTRTREGRSLLHLVTDPETQVETFNTRDIVRVPHSAVTKLFLKCGADPSAQDDDGNSPLHMAVKYRRVVADFQTLHRIICSLLQNGAHADIVNKSGKTPFQSAATGIAEIILKSQIRPTLKCLAAQAVMRYGIEFQGQVPESLEPFIRLHGQ